MAGQDAGVLLQGELMLRLAKQFIPLALRTRLKWLGYALQDGFKGPQAQRVPPRRQTFIGGGDFVSVGEDFFLTLKRHGLTPDMDVLDVGCGQGRMARPMIGFFEDGEYIGFDIVRSGIKWCQTEYAELSTFKFLHADVYNERYNKSGKVAAKDFKFPFEDNSFDRIFLTSVFTHMFAHDVANYLSEISRVLRPGGKTLISWFLLDDVSRLSQHPVLNFRYAIDAVSSTTVKSNPEAAIAFDLDYVKSLYEQSGLRIKAIEDGQWARPESQYSLQDLIIAQKA